MSSLAEYMASKGGAGGGGGVAGSLGSRASWNADTSTSVKKSIKVPPARKITWNPSQGAATAGQTVHASAPGLIIPTSPLQSQAPVKSTYTVSPKVFQKKINARRNDSQVALALNADKKPVEKPMRSGKMVSQNTAARNTTTFQLGGGSFSAHPNQTASRTSADVGKHHNEKAIPEKAPWHAAHVSSENTLVTQNLRSVVAKDAASPKTRKTQILKGLNSLRQPLHSTPDVPYLQQHDTRQKEYVAKNLHSENTKWFRKHVEHRKM